MIVEYDGKEWEVEHEYEHSCGVTYLMFTCKADGSKDNVIGSIKVDSLQCVIKSL